MDFTQYWVHRCNGRDHFVPNALRICEECGEVKTYPLRVDLIKRVYNWFHHAFPEYESNKNCTEDDIRLRNDLEQWLIESGE